MYGQGELSAWSHMHSKYNSLKVRYRSHSGTLSRFTHNLHLTGLLITLRTNKVDSPIAQCFDWLSAV